MESLVALLDSPILEDSLTLKHWKGRKKRTAKNNYYPDITGCIVRREEDGKTVEFKVKNIIGTPGGFGAGYIAECSSKENLLHRIVTRNLWAPLKAAFNEVLSNDRRSLVNDATVTKILAIKDVLKPIMNNVKTP